jgi:iron complex outermembrane receptor protein
MIKLSRKTTLACSAAIGVMAIASAASAQQRAFNIPSEDAPRAIAEFARQADVQIVAPVTLLHGVKTPAVAGSLDTRVALRQLLAGTGLHIASDTGTVIALRLREPSETVNASSVTLAVAQGAPAAETAAPPTPPAPSGLAEVVVTARKRSESLLTAPVTVTAFTAQALEAKGIANLTDVASFSPGVKFNSVGTGRADRSNQQIIIRGMTPNFNGNVSVFIDGAPVVGYGFVEGVEDLERVEVLKGPQSATFGRATFSGAMNLVTKDPTNTYHASVDAQVMTYNGYDLRAAIEGPIIPDKLTFRLQGRDYHTDGSYKNAAISGATIGDQASYSMNGALKATPSEHLTIKVFGNYWIDHDGSGATYKLSYLDYNCAAGAAGAALNYTCGALPKANLARLGYNDQVDAPVQNQILRNALKGIIPYPGIPQDFTNHFGLERRAYHTHGIIEYDLPQIDATISSLTSYDSDVYVELQDIDLEDTRNQPNALATAANATTIQPYVNWPTYVPFSQVGYSQEFRIQGGAHQRFHWLLGGSYVHQDTGFAAGALLAAGFVNFQTPSTTVTETAGGFFSLGYDITSQITVSFEGRYQNEKQTLYNLSAGRVAQAAESSNNFLPRALIQYKPSHDLMVYASYSEGLNPGGFNSNLTAFTPAQATIIQARYGIGLTVAPETLKNYELGVKGKFWDGRAQVTADVYHAVWTNQVVENDVTINGVPGVPAGDQVQINENIGQTDLNGVELEAVVTPMTGLTIDSNFGYTPSDIRKYTCLICQLQVNGKTDVVGHHLSHVPAITFNLGVEYKHPLTSEIEGYARVDWQYQDKIYEDETNLAWIPANSKVNLRLGGTRGGIRVEGFVTNLFDDITYTNAQLNEDLVHGFGNDVVAGLPQRRTFGLRVKASF